MKNKIILIAVTAILISAFSNAEQRIVEHSDSFYDRKAEGWFWYEPEPEIKTEPEPKPKIEADQEKVTESPSQKEEPKNVVVDVAWLRVNIPKLRDAAIDDPTYDNVRRYFYAQRVMMDKATKFATVSQEVSKFERPLDETLRRPEHQSALIESRSSTREKRDYLVEQLSEKVGFFFFYSSNCAYCIKQAPFLKRVSHDTGVDVLAISFDGKPLPNGEFPDYVTDQGVLRDKLQVTVTPTVYLVTKDGSEFHNIAAGLTSPDELIRRTIMLANKKGWISEDQYNETKEVKEILLADDTKEKLYVDPDKVYSDPNYLADKLRKNFMSKYKINPSSQSNSEIK